MCGCFFLTSNFSYLKSLSSYVNHYYYSRNILALNLPRKYKLKISIINIIWKTFGRCGLILNVQIIVKPNCKVGKSCLKHLYNCMELWFIKSLELHTSAAAARSTKSLTAEWTAIITPKVYDRRLRGALFRGFLTVAWSEQVATTWMSHPYAHLPLN